MTHDIFDGSLKGRRALAGRSKFSSQARRFRGPDRLAASLGGRLAAASLALGCCTPAVAGENTQATEVVTITARPPDPRLILSTYELSIAMGPKGSAQGSFAGTRYCPEIG